MNGSPEPAHAPPPTTTPDRPAASPSPAAPEPAARTTPTASRPAGEWTRYAAPPGAAPGLQPKSPVIAGLLSLMPGAGQIYVGYYKIGFTHNVVFGTTIALLADGGGPFPGLFPAIAIFLPFFVIYNIVDASRRANLYNLALDGGEGIDLPNMDMDMSLPNLGGSIGGGVILIVLGAVLLSNTLLGIPLDWLAAWWPVIPLGLGVHLLAKALRERQAAAAHAPDASRGAGSEPSP